MKKVEIIRREKRSMKNRLSFISGFLAFLLFVMPFSSTVFAADGGNENEIDVRSATYKDSGVRDDVYEDPEEPFDPDYPEYPLPEFPERPSAVPEHAYAISKEVLDFFDLEEDYFQFDEVTVYIPKELVEAYGNLWLDVQDVSAELKEKYNDALALKSFYLYDKSGKKVTDFGNAKIKLVFFIDPDKVTNWDDIKVVYINENGEMAEIIEPIEIDKEAGIVVVEVSHFSTYGVFENPTLPESTDESNDDSDVNGTAGSDGKDQGNGDKLPKTATNLYNLLLLGSLLLISGIVLFLKSRKSATI